MLLFPEVQSATPLDIDIMDTLFFLPDHSFCYVYKVPPPTGRTTERDSPA